LTSYIRDKGFTLWSVAKTDHEDVHEVESKNKKVENYKNN